MLEATFVNGLRPNVQAELRQLELMGLMEKMRAAQKFEKQLTLQAYHSGLLPRWPKPIPVAPFAGQHAEHVTIATAVPRASRLLSTASPCSLAP